MKITQKIDDMMGELGHPDNLIGTECLRIGVAMYDPRLSMTKDVYPFIAAAVQSTPTRVERAMRHSIEVAWNRGDMHAANRFFGYRIDPERGRPTVGEYLATMAKLVRRAEDQE